VGCCISPSFQSAKKWRAEIQRVGLEFDKFKPRRTSDRQFFFLLDNCGFWKMRKARRLWWCQRRLVTPQLLFGQGLPGTFKTHWIYQPHEGERIVPNQSQLAPPFSFNIPFLLK
jgi:hypothetical protein